jgi:signal-transduction protein with cAMP-binding, CBS, and nucleotidyltransferase domain
MNLSEVNKVGITKIYTKDSVILDERSTDTVIFIVLQGKVEVIEAKINTNIIVAAGEFFGGIPILQDHIRLYSAIALEDNTTVFQIHTSTHNSLLEKCPDMYSRIFIRLLNNVRAGIDELNKSDPVSATLYKLNPIYARINLLKDSELVDMVYNDTNYTIFSMRFLSDLCNKMNLSII